MEIFGTSGMRGKVEGKLNPLNVMKLALSFSRFLGNDGVVGLGRDARLGNEVIRYVVLSGLLSGGLDVIDFGLTSTPALLHASRDLDGSVMLTGSHTPPEIHGILLFREDTAELFGEDESAIERIFSREEIYYSSLRELGRFSTGSPLEAYREDIRRVFPRIPRARVVLDVGHSPSADIFKHIFPEVEFVLLNEEVDGEFPNRPPEPRSEDLKRVGRIVREERAKFGLLLDGDGDRAIFLDERGHIIQPDYLGVIFALEESSKGIKKVACPVNTSSVVEILKERDVKIIYTRIGPPAMAKAIVEENAGFAFEESGKYIWPKNILYGDPAYATALLLNLEENLSELIKKLPKRYSYKKAVPCPEELKKKVLKEIIEMVHKIDGEILMIDGIRITLQDGSWILLRPSGTEPVFRCHVEAITHQRLNELKELALKILWESFKGAGIDRDLVFN